MENASRSIPAIPATIKSDRSAGFKSSFLSWCPTNSSRTTLSRPEKDTVQAIKAPPSVCDIGRCPLPQSSFPSNREERQAGLQQAGRRESLGEACRAGTRPPSPDRREVEFSPIRGHRRICSKRYERRARDFAGLNPLLERLGRPDVVAIEADELPRFPHLSKNREKTC